MDALLRPSDPFDWSIDDVIQAFCNPEGLLAKKRMNYDLAKLEICLRENDISGEILLSGLDDDGALQEVFSFKSFGLRKAFRNQVQTLKTVSEKWLQSLEGIEERRVRPDRYTPTPGMGNGSVYEQRTMSSFSSRSPAGLLSVPTDSQLLPSIPTSIPMRILQQNPGISNEDMQYNFPGVVEEPALKKRKIAPEFVRSISTNDATKMITAKALKEKQASVESSWQRSSKKDRQSETISVLGTDAPGYIGFCSTPVNRLFYAGIQLGEEVQYKDLDLHPFEVRALKDGEWSEGLSPEKLEIEASTETVFRLNKASATQRPGQSLYVNGRMKYFLRTSNSLAPKRFMQTDRRATEISRLNGRGYSFGTAPYPPRLLKYAGNSQSPSLTIFSQGSAKRVRTADWEELDSDAAEAEDTWDLLEARWKDAGGDGEVLPGYGESGSEGKVYSDSDESEEETPVTSKHSAPRLTEAEARAIIAEECSRCLQSWETNKLPRLEMKAWSTWHRAKFTRREDIRMCKSHIERLEDRLDRLISDLLENRLEKADELRKLCGTLHITIKDKAATEWKLRVLAQSTPPPRPRRSRERDIPRVQDIPTDLASNEEELTSEEDYNFIEGIDDFIDDDDDGVQAAFSPNIGDVPEVSDLLDHELSMVEDATTQCLDAELATPKVVPDLAVSAGEQKDELLEGSSFTPEEGEGDNADMQSNYMDVDEFSQFPAKERSTAQNTEADTEDKPSLTKTPTPESDLAGIDADKDSSDSLIAALHNLHPPQESSSLSSRVTSEGLETDEPSSESDVLPNPDLPDHADTSGANLVDSLTRQRDLSVSNEENRDDESGVIDEKSDIGLPQGVKFWSTDLEPIESGSPEPSMSTLPGPHDFPKLKVLSREWYRFICANGLRSHLLGCLVSTAPHRWRLVEAVMVGKQSAEMMHPVWSAMENLQKGEFWSQESEGMLQLATWFVAWFCLFAPKNKGIHRSKLMKTINSGEQSFHEFWTDLEEVILLLKDKAIEPKSRPPPKFSFKRKAGEGQGVSVVVPRSSKVMKKNAGRPKKVLTESQEMVDVRASAAERKRQSDKRARLLHKNLIRGSNQDAKVYINQGKTEDQDFVEVNEHIASRIKPHQIEGINFLWREIVGAGEGVLLAHVMGLGKTMQCITLLVTILEASKSLNEGIREQVPENLRNCKTLIVCPPSLVDNWHDELLKWVPQPRTEHIGEIRMISTNLKTKFDRLYEIGEWKRTGGVLLISYSLLVPSVLNKKAAKAAPEESRWTDEEHKTVRSALLEHPNIVIADEAQYFKNPASKVSTVMKQFKTKTRIALTGSPLSNNLAEYFHIINWACKGYLGSYAEFRDEFELPISRGLYSDVSRATHRRALTQLRVLENELSPKVHRADYNALKGQIKGKTEFLLFLPPTEIQRECYNAFVSSLGADAANAHRINIIGWMGILKLLCNSPKCFQERLKEANIPAEIKDTINEQTRKDCPSNVNVDLLEAEAEQASQTPIRHMGLSEAMIEQHLELLQSFDPKLLRAPQSSSKMDLLASILAYSRSANEKTLVFSHSIHTLDYIEKRIVKDYKVSRIDGATPATSRQELAREFNEGNKEVMLVSTRAGGAGLNLFGASRVVIIDDSFNPMNEQQAIGRAYRIGQQRHVYVYRLVIAGSFEEPLQNQGVYKLQLATRVVDKKDTVRSAMQSMGRYIFPLEDKAQQDLQSFVGKDPMVLDNMIGTGNGTPQIRSIVQAESFFAEEKETLTPEEEAEAQEKMKLNKLRRQDPQAYDQRMRAKQWEILKPTNPVMPIRPFYGSSPASMPPVSDVHKAIENRLPYLAQNNHNVFFGGRNPGTPVGHPVSQQLLQGTSAEQELTPNRQQSPVTVDLALLPQTASPKPRQPLSSQLASGIVNNLLHGLSDEVRQGNRLELEACLQKPIATPGSGLPLGISARGAYQLEMDAYRSCDSIEAYFDKVARIIARVKSGILKADILELPPSVEGAADSVQAPGTGKEPPQLLVEDQGKVSSIEASKSGEDKNATKGSGSDSSDEGSSDGDSGEANQVAAPQRHRRTEIEPLSMAPVAVERISRENEDVSGENPAEAISAANVANVDGPKDEATTVRFKSEHESDPQHTPSTRTVAPSMSVEFREPPGFPESQPGKKRAVEVISLMTSDEDSDRAPSAKRPRNEFEDILKHVDSGNAGTKGSKAKGSRPSSKDEMGSARNHAGLTPNSEKPRRDAEASNARRASGMSVHQQSSTPSRILPQSYPALARAIESGTKKKSTNGVRRTRY